MTRLGITIRYLAHASFKIKTENQVIYVDPSEKHTGLRGDNLEPADLILVTHNHADHCDPDLIKKIRKLGSPIIAPANCREILGEMVWDMRAGEFMKTSDGISIRAVEAYNVKRFRPSGEPFHPQGLGVGFVLTIEGRRIYHAGDTDLIPEMENLGDIDVALLPCGDTYTMDMNEASDAALMIQPRVAIPIHLKSAGPEVFKHNVESKSETKVVILTEDDEYALNDRI
ncbi:MAG: MBL fold metallo-hydrolase [Candidatus Thorarchaeota archaeon]